MTIRPLLAVTIAVGVMVVRAMSIPVHSIDVARLAAVADIIVVGHVVSITPQGPDTVESSAGLFTATRFRGTLKIDRALKGSSGESIVLEFVLPDQPAEFRGVAAGQYGMFFLKAFGDHWEFVDPVYPALPAARSSQSPLGTPQDQVTVTLGQVLISPKASESDYSQALEALSRLHTDLSTRILRQSLKDSLSSRSDGICSAGQRSPERRSGARVFTVDPFTSDEPPPFLVRDSGRLRISPDNH
jgi:hypothetical protein